MPAIGLTKIIEALRIIGRRLRAIHLLRFIADTARGGIVRYPIA
jgi:hypothetical protein